METKTRERGLALLITLILVSVVLAIGLSLLNITLKQFTLSSTARDSEIAFHAANTGLECMQFYRADDAYKTILLNDDGDPDTSAPSLACAGASPSSSGTSHYLNPADGQYVYNYTYQYTIDNTCVETSMYLMDMRESDDELTRTVNEGLDTISCDAGVVCTTIFSRGYNRPCGNLSSIRIVQRELTIQF
jgi:hypothetical protein